MYRGIEKKEWRKNIEACFDVQSTLSDCVYKSTTYQEEDRLTKSFIKSAIAKEYIWDYLSAWENPEHKSSTGPFYNTNSQFWKVKADTMNKLNEECNVFSLQQCCQEKYNLDNMKGNYHYAFRFVTSGPKKKEDLDYKGKNVWKNFFEHS